MHLTCSTSLLYIHCISILLTYRQHKSSHIYRSPGATYRSRIYLPSGRIAYNTKWPSRRGEESGNLCSEMEIFKWAEVVCSNRRSGRFWLIFGGLSGFSAVVFALALCARNALRHGVQKEEDDGTERAWLHWPGWNAVKNGGAAEGGGGGGEMLRGPQQLYALIRNNGSFSGRVRTGDVAGAKRKGNQTGIPVWQRRILMGERCRLPDYSGLILYDEYGNPLPQNPNTLQDVMK